MSLISKMKGIKTFKKGGIHPPYYKDLTAREEIIECSLPDKICIPLTQNIGAHCEPIVKPGDYVKVGQKIGETRAYIGAPIHSSVSGQVTDIEPRPHFTGFDVKAIVIKPDFKQEMVDFKAHEDFKRLSPDELRGIIREAGIVGLGGAAFPTYVKLSPPKDKKIDSIIINGCECEPFLSCDHRSMLEQTDDIFSGLKIAMQIVEAQKGYIGIEVNKMDAIAVTQERIKREKEKKKAGEKEVGTKDLEVVPLAVKYPEGGEKQLIKAILDRDVPLGKLPSEVGVLVLNIQTSIAIANAVIRGKPLFERVVTVSGPFIKRPKNLRVKIGTPIHHLIEQCGGLKENPEKYIRAGHMRYDTKVLRLIFKGEIVKVIVGGPMTGFAQPNLLAPVVKGTSGVLAFPESMIPVEVIRPCLKCGKCNQACPMLLMPSLLGTYIEKRKIEAAGECGVLDCIECGCCAYVCPGNRPLIHLIRLGKSRLLEKKKGR